jgi:predicted RNA polymerase sigma factor
VSTPDARRAVEAVWRMESARIIAGLAGLVRDVGLAEELAQDALVAALEQWPAAGIPPNPGGWLMVTAKHRAIDRIRRNERLADKLGQIGRDLAAEQVGELVVPDEDEISDDMLRLMFISCHPVLSAEARIALTLRLLGGLTTDEIARGFLAPEPTIAKRIVRAKRTLSDRQIPFEVPALADRPARLASVLEVLYLIFNEGYSAMAGDDWMRPALCTEALRLGRVLAGLMPAEPEVHGLVALMEIQASRFHARLDADGLPVPLLEQNRGRWDQLLIRRGFAALLRAEQAAVSRPGPYVLQAAIAVCHAQAHDPADTDWDRIAALYGALTAVAPSPVVELNRAVAVAMTSGPVSALAIVDALAAEPALAAYHHLPSVRADLLARLGRYQEAGGEFRRAAALTRNLPERTVLLRRADECAQKDSVLPLHPFTARHHGGQLEVVAEHDEVGRGSRYQSPRPGEADDAGRAPARPGGHLGDRQAGRGDRVVDDARHRRGRAGDRPGAGRALGQAGHSPGHVHRLLAEVVLAVRHAGRRHRVGDEDDAAVPRDQPDRHVVQVRPVGDRLTGDPPVGGGVEQRARRARLPVVQRAHAVEQVGRVAGTGVDGGRGDLGGRVGVADSRDHAGRHRGTDQLGRPGQLGRDRDHAQVPAGGRAQPFEGGQVRVDQVPGILGAAPGRRQERPLQVNAVDDTLVGQIRQHRGAFGQFVDRRGDQAGDDPRAPVAPVEGGGPAGVLGTALSEGGTPAAVHVNVHEARQHPLPAQIGNPPACAEVALAQADRVAFTQAGDPAVFDRDPAAAEHAVRRDDPGTGVDRHQAPNPGSRATRRG